MKSVFSAGVLMNLASVDAENVMHFFWNSIHEIWASPMMIAISLIWLLKLLGPAALAGCFVMILSMFINGCRLITQTLQVK
jgi:hypothetical protein